MELDGKKQRNALTAAENAVKALVRGDAERAIRGAATAEGLDQIGAYTGLSGAVERAASDLDGGGISRESWDALSEVVGPGPVQAIIPSAGEPS